MLKEEHVFQKGAQSGMISDCVVENGYFFFIQRLCSSSEDNEREYERLSLFLRNLYNTIFKNSIRTLSDFQKSIHNVLSSSFSVDMIDGIFVVVRGEDAYLTTVGNGKIFLQRGKDCALIISGSQCAIGKIQRDDFFICVCNKITSSEVQKKLDRYKLADILSQFDDSESVLLVRMAHKEDEKMRSIDDILREKEKRSHVFLQNNRKYTFIVVAILCVILVWSVGFGVKRRMDQAFKKEIASYTLKITEALQHAQEKAVQSNNEAFAFINQAKKDLETLQEKVGARKIPQIQKLLTHITDVEKNIMKKEEQKYDEFYDLHLIEKDARGDVLSVDQDVLAVLDKNAGAVYVISLSKKSNYTIKKGELRESSLMFFYDNTPYVYKQSDGLYTVDTEKKLTRVIEKDTEWGHIVSFSVYNGNIYLLDGDKNDIYKYLVVDNGYSSKQSYFKKGQLIDFNNAHSLMIDSSIYIGTDHAVYKYTSGLKDGFSTKIPGDTTAIFTQLFTDKNVTKIYVLDKEQGRVLLFSKQGSFEKQIESSILKQTSSFVVREKNPDASDTPSGIFALVKNKIYTIPF